MPPQQAVSRKAAAAATRTKLIESGLHLAERTGLIGLSVNLLVDEAGVSKGSFFHHFGDRASYLLALHREFHDRIAQHIDQAIAGISPGHDRLMTGVRVYLDTCLQQRGIRALLLEARAEPAVAQEISRRNAEFGRKFTPDFAALGRQYPLESAQLLAATTAEAALIELGTGSALESVRTALAESIR